MQLVVVVEQGEELAAGHPQRVVGGGDDAGVDLPVLDPDARVAGACGGEDLAHVWGLGAVVDQAQLPVAEALAPHRAQHLAQHVGVGLVDRREDREARRRQGQGRCWRWSMRRAVPTRRPKPGTAASARAARLATRARAVVELGQPALGGAELGVLADQDVAQPQDLLVLARDLLAQLGIAPLLALPRVGRSRPLGHPGAV